jgi:hypothetical protein
VDQYRENWRGGRKVIAVLATIGVLWYSVTGQSTMAIAILVVAVLAIIGTGLLSAMQPGGRNGTGNQSRLPASLPESDDNQEKRDQQKRHALDCVPIEEHKHGTHLKYTAKDHDLESDRSALLRVTPSDPPRQSHARPFRIGAGLVAAPTPWWHRERPDRAGPTHSFAANSGSAELPMSVRSRYLRRVTLTRLKPPTRAPGHPPVFGPTRFLERINCSSAAERVEPLCGTWGLTRLSNQGRARNTQASTRTTMAIRTNTQVGMAASHLRTCLHATPESLAAIGRMDAGSGDARDRSCRYACTVMPAERSVMPMCGLRTRRPVYGLRARSRKFTEKYAEVERAPKRFYGHCSTVPCARA